MIRKLISLYDCLVAIFRAKIYFLTGLALRFGLAIPFWRSGQNKWNGFAFDPLLGNYELDFSRLSLSENTLYLFENEYHIPLLPPYAAALMGAIAEIFLPLLLILGFGTRFAATGLLVMTSVIQLFVFPDAYNLHITWAAMAMALISFGPGPLSLDYLLRRK